MKKITSLVIGSSLGFAMSIGVAFTVGVNTKKSIHAEASSYSVSSVPTTIDLNDASDSTIQSYYSALNGLSTSERQGTNLLKNLKPILKNGQKYLSYGSSATTAVWQAYEIVDRDWSKSPASSISGYDSSTNKITGYVYGTSNSSTGTNPYVHALYVNRSVTNQTKAWGNHNQDQWGINQEHVWAKSCGFNDTSPAAGARGDIMHLWAGNGKVNGTYHSNYYYGYVDTTKSYDDASSYASTLSGNRKGYSKTLGGSYTVFEPQDSDKGDIARALFYMVARYNYLSGSDSDGIDAGNPNLEIVNVLNWAPGSSYTSTTSKKGQMGILQDLLEWNRLDPPDEWEIHRNNLCYNNFTNNRNPFIDYPEWAEYIWGKSVNGSYSSSSTGYATPSSDTINGFSSGGGSSTDPTVNYVTVSPTSLNLDLNGTKTGNLTATVNVSNGAAQTVTWSSNRTNVATVSSSGAVTAQAVGTATITVTSTVDSTKYATCTVNVIDSSSSGGESGTVDVSISTYATNNNWENGVKYTSISLDSVATASVGVGSTNTGKYYTSGNEWRFYQSENATIVVSVKTGYELDDVTFTYNSSNSGVLKDSSNNDVASDATKSISGTSATFSVGNTGSATNGQVKFTNISVTYHSTSGSTPTPTSITATVNKSYHPGEKIVLSDISVEDDYGNTITDFSFTNNNYQFTYADAPSGGEVGTKTFTNAISYSNLTTSLTVNVYRTAYEEVDGEEYNISSTEFNNSDVSHSNKTDSNSSVTIGGFSFAVTTNAYIYSNTYLSFGYNKAGSINNTNAFERDLTSVSFEEKSGSRTDGVLTISKNGSAYVDYSENEISKGGYRYFKIEYSTSSDGLYSNIQSISFSMKGEDTAINVANYIMFEDTTNQCNSKFSVAKGYFENLSTSEKNTFMGSSDYVITTARERLTAWATSKGESITLSGGEYVISSNRQTFNSLLTNNSDLIVVFITITSIISLTVLFGYFVSKKRKKYN